jgi:5-methylcytosine-specific restriction endonuclease McrA
MKPFKPTRALTKSFVPEVRGSRGGRWTRVSQSYRSAHPMCEVCSAKVSVVTHHLRPWQHYPALRYDYTNLQALCQGCHNDAHEHGTH